MSGSGSETRHDLLTPSLAARFAATLDRPLTDVALQGVHWVLCTPDAATGGLGEDGHPARGGGFLPESPLPRRMWASSDVRFLAPIAVGARIERRSTVTGSVEKQGGTGSLLFVTVEHKTLADGALAVEETQTLVYRGADAGGAAPPKPPGEIDDDWTWRRRVTPTPPLLFRYSALTFNTHRIHYDLAYATGVEGYRGLVVHGPLMATLLLDLCDRELGPNRLATFSFRAVAPAFCDEPVDLLGRERDGGLELIVRSADGRTHVSAKATRA